MQCNISENKVNNKFYKNLLKEGCSQFLAKILASRQIESMEDIEFNFKNMLPLKTLNQALEVAKELYKIIVKEPNKKIVIAGDYDCDGATATAITIRSFKMFGFNNVDYIIPDRVYDGYGLSENLVRKIKEKFDPYLIITVDNGTCDIKGVKLANDLGIKVIVTDHHLAGEELAPALYIVNPNIKNNDFQSKSIAGCGVIFYVMKILEMVLRVNGYFEKNKNLNNPNINSLLSLVALGTVADIVPLDKNNRILIFQGLQLIKNGYMPVGLKALCNVSGFFDNESNFLNQKIYNDISTDDLGFKIAPRLNAAGRLLDMHIGVECLISDDLEKVKFLANQLDELNKNRQNLSQNTQQEALEILEKELENIDFKDENAISLYSPKWHEGIIGLVASQIKEKFFKPVIVFSNSSDNNLIKGSARSIKGIHIRDILDLINKKYPNLLIKFGGHAMAAGLTIKKENFKKFKNAFNKIVTENFDKNIFQQSFLIDGELENNEINIENAMLLEKFIWGQNFNEPLFKGTFNVSKSIILKEKYLKLILKKDNLMLNAIQFNNPDLTISDGDNIQVIYKLKNNYFNNQNILQLNIIYANKI